MNLMSVRRFGCGLLVWGICLAQVALGQTPQSFFGQWVLKLGDRNFMVLTLSPGTATTGLVSGSLLRPEDYGTSNGELFFHISKDGLREPIVQSDLKAGVLSITVQNPNSAADQDRYQISLPDRDRAAVTYDGRVMDPWPFKKEDEAVALATDWEGGRTYAFDDSDKSNAEMTQIFQADQKIRLKAKGKQDFVAMFKTDGDRREATRNLLADGKLHTGEDYIHAAFIFQHGHTPDDYLLAHTLALIAVLKGKPDGAWIAAASLDRYLHSIDRAQIYGTQFKPTGSSNQPMTQEPYDRSLISDALRRQLGVPSQAVQEEQLKQ